jgi:hypothetical protein
MFSFYILFLCEVNLLIYLAPAWLAAVFQLSLKITAFALLLNASTTDLLAARRQYLSVWLHTHIYLVA